MDNLAKDNAKEHIICVDYEEGILTALRQQLGARAFDPLDMVESILTEEGLAPAVESGFSRAVFVARGRVVDTRTLPPGAGAALEVHAGIAACRAAEPSVAPEDAEEAIVEIGAGPEEIASLDSPAGDEDEGGFGGRGYVSLFSSHTL